MDEDWLFCLLIWIIKILTTDFDFLHYFTGLIVHFDFDRNRIAVIVELKGWENKRHKTAYDENKSQFLKFIYLTRN